MVDAYAKLIIFFIRGNFKFLSFYLQRREGEGCGKSEVKEVE